MLNRCRGRQENAISLVIRNFRWSDLEAYTALAMRIHGPYGWWAARSQKNMREWLGQPNLHPEKDLFLALDGPHPVGYLQCYFERPLKRVVLEGAVHPGYQRQGIGTRLINTSVALASQESYEVVHVAAPYGALNIRRLARKAGFRLVRKYWEMRLIDPWIVPPAKIPSGLTLRPFLEGDQEKLTFIQNLSFARNWGYSPNTAELVKYKTRMAMFRFKDILLLLDGEKAVGFNWTRLEPASQAVTGYICMMGTHPEYRGLGLGTAILRAGVDHLRREGANRIDLTVDSLNPSAYGIYRAGGFVRRAVTMWYERKL